ncbi:hypothetical protein FE391_41995 [Nonomuraea sp. KC401]|uniref:hypothetical protein n=1 Tax=unclassified Nonomuraea TaxID=2593643 RepID=UPI0010FD2DA0|nr:MULTISPECIES: hypothetical protein [unclassified Nonomuraea]NBF00082.1 hypothetical protein [Nonomuraea sp. K271]TLF54307.1 hypothetical protein FE391_41995 [Nonomuraea sp. KC401]
MLVELRGESTQTFREARLRHGRAPATRRACSADLSSQFDQCQPGHPCPTFRRAPRNVEEVQTPAVWSSRSRWTPAMTLPGQEVIVGQAERWSSRLLAQLRMTDSAESTRWARV